MSFVEVALGFFGLFLLISPFGRLEHLICETLESVVVSSLVLSLRVKNTYAIQEAFKFTRSRPILLIVSRSLHRFDETIHFALFLVAHRRARLVRVA
jgi:hypothetical protein